MSVVSAEKTFLRQTVVTATRREYIQMWKVVTNSASDQCITVRGALPGPSTTLSHGNDSDPEATVVGYGSIDPTEWDDGGRTFWAAEVMYSTQQPEACTTNFEESPLSRPAIITIRGRREQKVVRKDRFGDDVVNAAGDPFDDLFMDDTRLELTIQVNQATISEAVLDDYLDSVNAGTFFGLDTAKWKFGEPAVVTRYGSGCSAYFDVTYSFLSNKEGWDLQPANLGFRVKDAAGNAKFPIDTETGARAIPPQPIALAADGTQLPITSDIIYYDGTNGVLEPDPGPWEVYEAKDFGLLGIPTSF